MPSMGGQTLKRAAMSLKANTGVDGFRPKILMDLSDELCEEVVKSLHKVDMHGEHHDCLSYPEKSDQ